MGLRIVLYGEPRVMLRDTCAEYDVKKRGAKGSTYFLSLRWSSIKVRLSMRLGNSIKI